MLWHLCHYAAGGLLRVLLIAVLVNRTLSSSGAHIHLYWYTDDHCTIELKHIYNHVIGPSAGCVDVTLPTNPPGTQMRGYKVNCANDENLHKQFGQTALLVGIDNDGCEVSRHQNVLWYLLYGHGVCQQVQGDFRVWFKWEYPTATSMCGESLPSAAFVRTLSGAVTGDPVTWFADKREEFYLPMGGMLTPLLRSNDIQVLASARPGHVDDQWIDRIKVSDVAGNLVLDVMIRKNLTLFNRAHLLPDAFETMDVKMEWWRPGLLEVMPPGDAQFNHWSGISLGFGRVRHHGQLKIGPEPRREAVIVQSASLKILIISSAAREYFEERPDLGVEMSHLDMEVMEIRDSTHLEGILPELWGLRPMSEHTRSLRKEPDVELETESTSNTTQSTMTTSSLENCSLTVDTEMPPILTSAAAGNCHRADTVDAKAPPIASVEGYSGAGSFASKGNGLLESSAAEM